MPEEKNNFIPKTEEEITITRIFNATRELVWKTWTEPKHIKRWWGLKDFTSSYCDIDFRVGGVFLFCMRSPEGREYWNTGIFREIVEPSHIVCTDSFADERGNVVPASFYGMSANFPLEMLWTIELEEFKENTKFTLRYSGLPSGDLSDMAAQGWNQTLDKFAETLKYSLPRNIPSHNNLTINR